MYSIVGTSIVQAKLFLMVDIHYFRVQIITFNVESIASGWKLLSVELSLVPSLSSHSRDEHSIEILRSQQLGPLMPKQRKEASILEKSTPQLQPSVLLSILVLHIQNLH